MTCKSMRRWASPSVIQPVLPSSLVRSAAAAAEEVSDYATYLREMNRVLHPLHNLFAP